MLANRKRESGADCRKRRSPGGKLGKPKKKNPKSLDGVPVSETDGELKKAADVSRLVLSIIDTVLWKFVIV